jgi:hypothetical protein
MDAVELTPLQVERRILGPLLDLAIDGLDLLFDLRVSRDRNREPDEA